ncbi:MAG TPA: NADPH-dependent F420 reductase [Burkholderiaceae bacterium]|nr:NADPH-dependent F420 reductase [Burkholderiaceae bacterium]
MKVTVIGSGNMGSALAKQIAKAGHSLVVTGRNSTKAKDLAQTLGATYRATDAAQGADVVVLATPYNEALSALRAAGGLQGKIVVDISNPLTPDFMGLTIGHSTSAAEQIQKAFPEAKVVKAFNTVFAQVLAQGAKLHEATVPVFFASDDASAKETVKALIQSIGFSPIDAGPLKNARYLEPLAGLNIYLGYGAGCGTSIAPAWIGIG